MPPASRLPLFDLAPASQPSWLEERLARPVPPTAVGLSDGFRLPGREGPPIPAAVLVPLVNRPQGLQLLLTQRSAALPDHPGQICFPGGRLERADASHAAAGLRGTSEEIGLAPSKVRLLGQLANYETVSGYRVRPIVGWIDPPFDLAPDPVEVADVFEVPLEFILDAANHKRNFRMIGDVRRDYWSIPWTTRYIWGATAAMLLILHRTLHSE
jgi:8-oxo-dGTP pyrophosphatase MutT (NUDIX family)